VNSSSLGPTSYLKSAIAPLARVLATQTGAIARFKIEMLGINRMTHRIKKDSLGINRMMQRIKNISTSVSSFREMSLPNTPCSSVERARSE